MYFVHPQIKFNIKNLVNLFFCFLRKPEKKVLEEVEKMFPGKRVYFTDMGRSAFRLIVEEFSLQNSQMLVPAYICDIFFEIFKEYNISPIFLDIDKETFNVNPAEIERKITPQIKAVLVCHTYGLASDTAKIKQILENRTCRTCDVQTSDVRRPKRPLIIEDCAHALGGKINEKFLGNFGDAAFFSLYKIFPTLRGGMAILPEETKEVSLPKTRFSLRDFISLLNCFSVFGFLFKKYVRNIAPKYIRKEKLGGIGGLNRVSLNILSWQLKNFPKILARRKKLGLLFQEELKKMGFEVQNPNSNIFTFLSVLAPKNINRDELVLKLRKKGIFALRVWREPIVSNREVQRECGANLSQFPNTVAIAKKIINFPLQNFYTKKDIEKMIAFLKKTITSL